MTILRNMRARRQLCATILTGVALAGNSGILRAADQSALEEITVTARKTAETLISVPLAITALTARDLDARGIRDVFADVATYTPGFTFQNQSVNRNDRAFRNFTIRGIPGGTTSTRQAASIFLDGTYVAGGNIGGVTDIERVEIVKGPQSAYFGRSTFSGAINYITRVPGNEWRGAINAEYATFVTTDFSASIEGPIVRDRLSIRVGGRAYHTAGAYINIEEPADKLGQRDTKSLSASLYATPTDNLRVKAYVTGWEDRDGAPANAAFNDAHYNCNAGAAPVTTFNYICGKIENPPHATRVYNSILSPAIYEWLVGARGTGVTILGPDFSRRFGLKRRAFEAKASFDYDLPANYILSGNVGFDYNKWRFITDTSFRDTHNVPNANFGRIPDVLPYFHRSAAGDVYDKDHTAELRVTSPREQTFTWMLGGNYFRQDSQQATNAFGITGFVAATPINVFKITTYGVFASAGYEFSDDFALTLEGRYQWDQIYQQTLSGTNPTAEATFKVFTPRVILEYTPNDDTTLYVSYARGSRPGQFNTSFFSLTAPQQAEITASGAISLAVPEERIEMVEAGLKGMFLNQKLRLLAAAYYGKWRDRHIPSGYNFFTPAGVLIRNVAIQLPGGKVDLGGLELESTFKPVPELTIEGSFNIAVTDIKFTLCSDCLAFTGNQSPTGTQLPGYPKYKGTLSAEYTRPVSDEVSAFMRVDYVYTGKIYDTESNVSWIGPSSKVNLRVGVVRGETRVEIYGTNIFDDRTPSAFARNVDTLTGRNGIVVSLADKATFGIRVGARF